MKGFNIFLDNGKQTEKGRRFSGKLPDSSRHRAWGVKGYEKWPVLLQKPQSFQLLRYQTPVNQVRVSGLKQSSRLKVGRAGWISTCPFLFFLSPPTPYILLCSHRPLQQSGTRASALKKILLESSKPGDIKYSVIQGKWKCMGRVSTHKEDGDMPGILFYQPTTANILPSGRTLFFLDKLGGPKKRKPLDIEIWKSLRKMLSSPLTLVWMPPS